MPLVYVVTATIALTFWGISFKRVAAATLQGLIEQLTKAIHDFTVAYNENAVLFAWRKREVQLRNTIVNLRNWTRGRSGGDGLSVIRSLAAPDHAQVPAAVPGFAGARCARTFSMPGRSGVAAMIVNSPAQFGQYATSIEIAPLIEAGPINWRAR